MEKVKRIGFYVLVGGLVALVIAAAWTRHSYQKELTRLRNDLAERDVTIEVQKGVYGKLAPETDGLRSLLGTKDEKIRALQKQISSNHEELLSAQTLGLYWKKAYEGVANAKEEPAPTPGRTKVAFEKEFGRIKAEGYTLTNPPEAWVKVSQLKPLTVTLAVSQDSTGAWHSYATSDDDNTAIDIKLAGVNPRILEPHWYENLQLNLSFAAGVNNGGFSALAGVGVSYRIKQFAVGPAVFIGVSDRLDKYYGVNFSWRPFQR